MAYVSGVPQNALLIFLGDSSSFEVLRATKITKDGRIWYRLLLSPFEWTQQLLGIERKHLTFDAISPYGYVKREYPTSRILVVSDNPEKPVWIAFCTYDGTPPERKGKELSRFLDVIEENDSLAEHSKILEAEVKRLQRENYHYSIKSREFFETHQAFTKQRQLLPAEELGGEVEIKRKVETQQR